MVYVTTTNRMALRCDLPGCKATFHPRSEARNRDELRRAAERQAWRCLPDGRNFCCARHVAEAEAARRANGEPPKGEG